MGTGTSSIFSGQLATMIVQSADDHSHTHLIVLCTCVRLLVEGGHYSFRIPLCARNPQSELTLLLLHFDNRESARASAVRPVARYKRSQGGVWVTLIWRSMTLAGGVEG